MSNFWWGTIIAILYIPFLFLWGFTLFDLFRRRDLHGVAKFLWAVVILFLPILGILIYFITRPHELDAWSGDDYGDAYSTPRAGSQTSPAVQDIDTLTRLHDAGTLNDEEFSRLMGRVSV